MAAFVRNHTFMFRPLLGGVCIQSGVVREVGTLGCLLTSDGQDRYLLSAYHVLGRSDLSAATDGEPIFQPTDRESSGPGGAVVPVARLSLAHTDPARDLAAARIDDGVPSVPEILGVGTLAGAADPQVGMRVLKSGIATGVTEGIVVRAAAGRVEIEVPPGFGSKYELSAQSDSGAVWVERDSRLAVALHVGGHDLGVERAFAVPFLEALASLGLDLPPVV